MDNIENSEFYQIVEFIINKQSYFCIWFSSETEGFLSDKEKIHVFGSYDDAKSFAVSNQIKLENEMSTCNSDEMQRWAESSDNHVNCENVLDYWNIIQDVVALSNCEFLGNKRTDTIDDIYDKLFCGNNVLIDNEEDKYYPTWSQKELFFIKNIILDGAKVIKESLL